MSLTHARHRTEALQGCRRPLRLLSCMHRAQLLFASCACVLLDSGVSDVGVILKIQTYRTEFIDNARDLWELCYYFEFTPDDDPT